MARTARKNFIKNIGKCKSLEKFVSIIDAYENNIEQRKQERSKVTGSNGNVLSHLDAQIKGLIAQKKNQILERKRGEIDNCDTLEELASDFERYEEEKQHSHSILKGMTGDNKKILIDLFKEIDESIEAKKNTFIEDEVVNDEDQDQVAAYEEDNIIEDALNEMELRTQQGTTKENEQAPIINKEDTTLVDAEEINPKIQDIIKNLMKLKLKMESFDSKKGADYIKAKEAIATIYNGLETRLAAYKKDQDLSKFKESAEQFLKDECKAQIVTLNEPRGWKAKTIISNIMLAIATLFVGYGIGVLVTGRFSLYQPKTDAGNKIDNVTDSIHTISVN